MAPPNSSSNRPSPTLNGAQWQGSKAKDQVAQDMIDNRIPLTGPLNTKEIYDRLYANDPNFKNFPYIKERYDSRFKTLRTSLTQLYKEAEYDNKAIEEDLKKIPPAESNIKGELRWDGSPAQALLKEDIDNKLHEGLKPSELRETRDEYKMFNKTVFRKHIYQEVKARKPHHPAVAKTGYKKHRKRHFGDKKLCRGDEDNV